MRLVGRDMFRGLGTLALMTMLAPASAHAEPETEARARVSSEANSESHANSESEASSEPGPRGSLSLRTFYRSEDLKWHFAAAGVNVRSELSWDDVESTGLEAAAQIPLPGSLELRGQIGYGRIFDGEIQDSDYNGSNRTLEFSRSISQTDRGSVWDASLGLGWKRALGLRFAITPFVGVSYHQQNYNIRDGLQVVALLPSSLGPIAGLDSDYEGEWYGFFFGAEVRHRWSERLDLRASFTSHAFEYRADAFFNLRTDLGDPSFSHKTTAEGTTLEGEAIFQLDPRWTLELTLSARTWESDSGRTTFRFASGARDFPRFNDLDLEATRVSLGLVYSF